MVSDVYEFETTKKNYEFLKAVAKDSPVFISVVYIKHGNRDILCSGRILVWASDGTSFYSVHPGIQHIHVGRFKSKKYWQQLHLNKYMQLRRLTEDICHQFGFNYLLDRIELDANWEVEIMRTAYLMS